MEYDDNDGTSQTDEISQEDSKFTAETRLQLRNPVNRRTHPFEVLWKKRGGPVCYLILICEMFVCDERQVRAWYLRKWSRSDGRSETYRFHVRVTKTFISSSQSSQKVMMGER
jgi:hypothetical protein